MEKIDFFGEIIDIDFCEYKHYNLISFKNSSRIDFRTKRVSKNIAIKFKIVDGKKRPYLLQILSKRFGLIDITLFLNRNSYINISPGKNIDYFNLRFKSSFFKYSTFYIGKFKHQRVISKRIRKYLGHNFDTTLESNIDLIESELSVVCIRDYNKPFKNWNT